MKGTHWTGLILSIGMGCATKEAVEAEQSAEPTTPITEDASGGGDEESDGGGNDDPQEGSETGENLGGLDEGGSDNAGSGEDGEVADDDEGLVLPSGLNGMRVYPPVPLIDFYAVNRDGSSRSMEDLVDGPTVIWFYPAADTYG